MYGRGGAQFSFGPPATPEIIKNLLIANGVVFIAQLVGPSVGFDVTSFGVVQPAAVWGDFQIWRIFTYMWLHSRAPVHAHRHEHALALDVRIAAGARLG